MQAADKDVNNSAPEISASQSVETVYKNQVRLHYPEKLIVDPRLALLEEQQRLFPRVKYSITRHSNSSSNVPGSDESDDELNEKIRTTQKELLRNLTRWKISLYTRLAFRIILHESFAFSFLMLSVLFAFYWGDDTGLRCKFVMAAYIFLANREFLYGTIRAWQKINGNGEAITLGNIFAYTIVCIIICTLCIYTFSGFLFLFTREVEQNQKYFRATVFTLFILHSARKSPEVSQWVSIASIATVVSRLIAQIHEYAFGYGGALLGNVEQGFRKAYLYSACTCLTIIAFIFCLLSFIGYRADYRPLRCVLVNAYVIATAVACIICNEVITTTDIETYKMVFFFMIAMNYMLRAFCFYMPGILAHVT